VDPLNFSTSPEAIPQNRTDCGDPGADLAGMIPAGKRADLFERRSVPS
jgi:hypothetical protein